MNGLRARADSKPIQNVSGISASKPENSTRMFGCADPYNEKPLSSHNFVSSDISDTIDTIDTTDTIDTFSLLEPRAK